VVELTPLVQRLRCYGDGLPGGLLLMREAADEIERLREALEGTVHVLDMLRTYGRARYDYAQSRSGSMVNVAVVIDAGRAALEPNAEAPEPQR
jgi:hypothetical protein